MKLHSRGFRAVDSEKLGRKWLENSFKELMPKRLKPKVSKIG